MHTLTLRDVAPITHDTVRMTFERPDDYPDWEVGQAADLALDRDGWRDEAKPYTFVSPPGSDEIVFVIRSKDEHDGVSCRITDLAPGDTVLSGDPRGAIRDRGPGVFLAAGVGLTPMIPILRALADRGEGGVLVLSDKTERDLLLRDEWEANPHLHVLCVLSDEQKPGFHHGRIDDAVLEAARIGPGTVVYVCGPKPMEEAMVELLHARGVPDAHIVKEDH